MSPARMRVSVRYGTHLPALLQACLKTRGAVLELGVGVFSTPILHWLCAIQGRKLLTIDNDSDWYDWGLQYRNFNHQMFLVDGWEDAPIEHAWDVALIDHSPDYRRAIEIERLAGYARYIVCHDANGRYHKQYGYDKTFPLFAHRTVYDKADPHTVVLSNFVDLADFWE